MPHSALHRRLNIRDAAFAKIFDAGLQWRMCWATSVCSDLGVALLLKLQAALHCNAVAPGTTSPGTLPLR